jgi:hypothetical protein
MMIVLEEMIEDLILDQDLVFHSKHIDQIEKYHVTWH